MVVVAGFAQAKANALNGGPLLLCLGQYERLYNQNDDSLHVTANVDFCEAYSKAARNACTAVLVLTRFISSNVLELFLIGLKIPIHCNITSF